MKKELQSLIRLARELGARPDLVQGAGGNLSVKVGKAMFIKASGLRFGELSGKGGFVAVDHLKLRRRYAGKGRFDEKEETAFLAKCLVRKGDLRPSMEAGFHASLGKCVLHTHSVYANILNCSDGGSKIALDVCDGLGIDAAYLSYTNPGPDLAFAIGRLVAARKSVPAAIFLGNHGLIVSGASAAEVLALHEKINSAIRKRLKLRKYPKAAAYGRVRRFDVRKMKENMLFPDQAVFCGGNSRGGFIDAASEKEALAVGEIITAHSYILGSIGKLKMRPVPIPLSDVRYLTGMEAEKNRKNMMK